MPNPFEDVGGSTSGGFFDPEGTGVAGLFGGTIGKMLGLPTQQERTSQAEAKTMQALSGHFQASGNDPTRAINTFLNSPEGVQLMSQPGAPEIIKKWTEMITPKPPTTITTPAGAQTQVRDPYTGKVTQTINQPTSENQYVDHQVAQISQNPDSYASITRGAHLNPTQEQQRVMAITRMPMPDEDKQKWIAGPMSGGWGVAPKYDAEGKVMGHIFLDSSKGAPRAIEIQQPPSQGTGVSGPAGGASVPVPTPQVENAPTLTLPATAFNKDGTIKPEALPGRMGMGFGAGPLAQGVGMLGTALRWINPSNKEPISQAVKNANTDVDQLETAMAGLTKTQKLASQVKIIQDLVPSKWTDTRDAYNKLERIHNWIDTMEAQEAPNVDPKNVIHTSSKQREESREVLNHMAMIRSFLPTRTQIQQVRTLIDQGKFGLNPVQAGKAAAGMVQEGLQGAVGATKELATGQPQPRPGQPQAPSELGGKIPSMTLEQLNTTLPNLSPGTPEWDAAKQRLQELGTKKKPGKQSKAEGRTQVAGGPSPYRGLPSDVTPPALSPTNPFPPSGWGGGEPALNAPANAPRPALPALPRMPYGQRLGRRTPFSQVG